MAVAQNNQNQVSYFTTTFSGRAESFVSSSSCDRLSPHHTRCTVHAPVLEIAAMLRGPAKLTHTTLPLILLLFQAIEDNMQNEALNASRNSNASTERGVDEAVSAATPAVPKQITNQQALSIVVEAAMHVEQEREMELQKQRQLQQLASVGPVVQQTQSVNIEAVAPPPQAQQNLEQNQYPPNDSEHRSENVQSYITQPVSRDNQNEQYVELVQNQIPFNREVEISQSDLQQQQQQSAISAPVKTFDIAPQLQQGMPVFVTLQTEEPGQPSRLLPVTVIGRQVDEVTQVTQQFSAVFALLSLNFSEILCRTSFMVIVVSETVFCSFERHAQS